MNALYKRELRSYFHGLIGWLYCTVYLVWVGVFFLFINLQGLYPQFETALSYHTLILLLIVPILTMRSFAEEKRQKTDQLLFSLPLSMTKIVLAKYFAILTVIAIPMLVTCLYPLILVLFGTVNLLETYASIFATFLFAALLAALGVFLSCLSETPAIAAILSLVVNAVLFFLTQLIGSQLSTSSLTSLVAILVLIVLVALIVYLLTKSFVASYVFGALFAGGTVLLYFFKKELFAGAINGWISALSPIDRIEPFMSGIFDLGSVVYFLSGVALFLFFSIQAEEKRRWS